MSSIKRVQQYRAAMVEILRWIRRDFIWSLLVVPMLSSAIVYILSVNNVNGWGESGSFKNLMEIVHPSLLAGFVLVAWGRWWLSRDASFMFLGVLGLCVLSREIVGQGSSFIVYIGIAALFVYASAHQMKLRRLLTSHWTTSFLFMCFLCYATSQFLDRGLIKRIGWLILWDTSWQVPFSSNIEEALESLGGAFLLLTPSLVAKKG
ncbi:MAG: hypothetical protein VCD00_14085 [Candidatus Hydrogenedentota bacterium]